MLECDNTRARKSHLQSIVTKLTHQFNYMDITGPQRPFLCPLTALDSCSLDSYGPTTRGESLLCGDRVLFSFPTTGQSTIPSEPHTEPLPCTFTRRLHTMRLSSLGGRGGDTVPATVGRSFVMPAWWTKALQLGFGSATGKMAPLPWGCNSQKPWPLVPVKTKKAKGLGLLRCPPPPRQHLHRGLCGPAQMQNMYGNFLAIWLSCNIQAWTSRLGSVGVLPNLQGTRHRGTALQLGRL